MMKVWHSTKIRALVVEKNDEVNLIVFRYINSANPMQIAWIPYCPMRDGDWEEFTMCFRIKYWAYASDLYKQAERECEN